MDLKTYLESRDSNLFWRLQAGDIQNLLDEAIERIQSLEQKKTRPMLLQPHRAGGWEYEVLVLGDVVEALEKHTDFGKNISMEAVEDVIKVLVMKDYVRTEE